MGGGNKMSDLQMFTQAQLMKFLNCSESHVTFLREMGIIPAIRTGRNYMFSSRAINNFYKYYEGLDVSSRIKAIQSKQIVDNRNKA